MKCEFEWLRDMLPRFQLERERRNRMITGISCALSKGFRKRKWRSPTRFVGICLAENFTGGFPSRLHFSYLPETSLFIKKNPRFDRIYGRKIPIFPLLSENIRLSDFKYENNCERINRGLNLPHESLLRIYSRNIARNTCAVHIDDRLSS